MAAGPTFASIEGEAAFWDTQSITDFEDELTVVTELRFVKARPTNGLKVRLEAETLAALTARARARDRPLHAGPSVDRGAAPHTANRA